MIESFFTNGIFMTDLLLPYYPLCRKTNYA